MVEVGVCQEDRIDAVRRDGERLPVFRLQIPFLGEAAVDENGAAGGLQQEARPRDAACGPEEAQARRGGTFMSHFTRLSPRAGAGLLRRPRNRRT